MPDEDMKLQSLAGGRPGITPAWGEGLVEAAAVCLEDQQHASGIELRVRGDWAGTCRVYWPEIDEQVLRCWNDATYTTEHGAYGIAILIAESVTGLTVIERSDKGTHVDFWLGVDDDDQPPFLNQARLEVSGIRRGGDSAIATRMKEKVTRLEGTDSPLPTYVIVVEFSSPVSEVQDNERHKTTP